MLNFVLCDDNESALTKFAKMLDIIFVNNDLNGKIVFTTSNPHDVFTYVKNNSVDVVILDIDLKSNISGLDIATKIRDINKKIYIIFASAHLEYLILAYKCKTFDYLTKPITLPNLEKTILRLYNDIIEDDSNSLFIKIGNKDSLVKSDSIYFIEKNNTQLVFRGKNADYNFYSSFAKIESNLPKSFIRCHKSYIVNLKNVDCIIDNVIHFDKKDKIKCYIGNVYKKHLMEVINNEFSTIVHN